MADKIEPGPNQPDQLKQPDDTANEMATQTGILRQAVDTQTQILREADSAPRYDNIDLDYRRAKASDEFNKMRFEVLIYCRRIVHDEQYGEDATQETGLKVVNGSGKFDGNIDSEDYKFRGWVFRIARNKCIDFQRWKGRLKEQLSDPEWLAAVYNGESSGGLPLSPEQQEYFDALEDCLNKLEDSRRTQLLLKEIEGLTVQEIADLYGVTKQAISTGILGAKIAMQECLKVKGYDDRNRRTNS